jgi:hypothetical protein
MTKRGIAIVQAKSAGYHNDTGDFTRLLIESRVRRELLNEAWHQGQRMKAAGMQCGCFFCKQAADACRGDPQHPESNSQ